ncbi:MAG: hypothetical protein WKF84_26920 [Pyrinomonadaceae bacterium]
MRISVVREPYFLGKQLTALVAAAFGFDKESAHNTRGSESFTAAPESTLLFDARIVRQPDYSCCPALILHSEGVGVALR